MLIRSKRRSISLHIAEDGWLLVRAPYWLSEDTIRKFVKDKENWIRRTRIGRIEEKEKIQKINVDVLNSWKINILGKSHKVVLDNRQDKFIQTSNELIFPSGSKEQLAEILQRWFVNASESYLGQRIEILADQFLLPFDHLGWSRAKSRWGSCSAKRKIILNRRLFYAPTEISDYVIIHELSHLQEANHSIKFWKRVEEKLPDYALRRHWLRKNGSGLRLLIINGDSEIEIC